MPTIYVLSKNKKYQDFSTEHCHFCRADFLKVALVLYRFADVMSIGLRYIQINTYFISNKFKGSCVTQLYFIIPLHDETYYLVAIFVILSFFKTAIYVDETYTT